MARRKRVLPFWLLPASYGLHGRSRQVAEAEYLYRGEELDRRLLDIEHPMDSREHKLGLLNVQLKYGHLADYDYEVAKIKLDNCDAESRDFKERKLRLDLDHKKIDERGYNRALADLREEPYIAVIHSEYQTRLGLNGLTFEFDWNDLWIDYLALNGYNGNNPEQIIERWFTDVCRSVVLEADDETPIDVPFNSRRVVRRRDTDG